MAGFFVMDKRLLSYIHEGHAVTSNAWKVAHLLLAGRNVINPLVPFDHSLVRAVNEAEGVNNQIIPDNDPDKKVVMGIARKKGLGMLPLVKEHYIRTTDTRIFYAMDSVYAFKQPNGKRYVANKFDKYDDLVKFWKKMAGSSFYSNSGIAFVSPFTDNIPFEIFVKTKIGVWLGESSDSFQPNPKNALGITVSEAIKHGLVKPDHQIKIEIITYDHVPSSDDVGEDPSTKMVQKNYEIYLPFDSAADILQQTSLGIIPTELLLKIGEPIKIQKFT